MKLPAQRTGGAPVAPSSNGTATAPSRPVSEHERTQAAWLEALGRISNLHADLAAELSGLAQIFEETVAHCGETSLMAEVQEIATPERDLLTSNDLANLLQCHPRTLRRLELLGELPAPIRTGRRKRWLKSEIDEWLAQRGGDSR